MNVALNFKPRSLRPVTLAGVSGLALAASAMAMPVVTWPAMTVPAMTVPASSLISSLASIDASNSAADDDVAGADKLREDMRKLIGRARDKVFPALVNVSTITVEFEGGKETKGGATGSGTIISPEGYVLTNAHVTDHGKKFRLTLADKQEIPATLVGEDPLTDLAVLKLDLTKLKPGTTLSVAEFADSDTLQVGDYVLAMGSPFSLSRSVSMGIVSNTERVFAGGSGEAPDMELAENQRTGIFTRWIQHDALINPGNSGGPLVNIVGQVVGVNTRGGSGMGFASPSNLARPVAEQLIKNGEVPRSSIGVAIRTIKRTDYTEGALVNSVEADSPAAKAGVQSGDLILAMNGAPVTIRFEEEIPALARKIADMPVGSDVTLKFRRGSDEKEVTFKTTKLLRDRGEEAGLRTWGITIREITEKMARDRRLADTKGALVFGVRSGGPAALAEPNVQWGDIIRSIDGQRVDTVEDVVKQYRSIMSREKLPEFVLIEYDRLGKNTVTLIKPKPEKPDDPPREVAKPWIGVATQVVLKDLADKLGISDKSLGFRVTRVYPGTEASKAGVQVGDVIVSFNGEALKPRGNQDAGTFQRLIRKATMSEPAKLAIIRDGKPLELAVPLERTRITQDEALKDENKDFEIKVRELTFFDRDDNRWDDSVKGVMVEDAEQAGWAGLAGVYSRDVIQKINGVEITDIPSWRKAMDAIAKAQPERVSFLVLRQNRTFFFFAEPDWKPTTTKESKEAAGDKEPKKPD